ncbi:MAG: TonB-dependent receptor plug, partial [Segetibacter sp.]|nr:TonB-dependent receptor plug [Segetibacter sp.]
DNQPMQGVTVQVKGATNSTATDAKGHYQLRNISSSDSLFFSSVGFRNETVAVNSRTEVNINLQAEASALDQVVVVGYGTQRKSDLTGSVTRVAMDDKSLRANTNIFQALSGATAGVNVQGAGGAGSEPNLSIRGQTSLSASDRPLIVLDGIIYNGSISDINVSDVESVDILKDASAAAVYGSRSANGVMIITTKKGKTEKPVISFNMYNGFQDMTNNPMKVMNAEQYAIRLVDYYYQQDLYAWYKTNPTSAAGKPVRPSLTDRTIVAARLRTQEERDNYIAGKSIDWVKEVLQPAPIQNYNLSLSGKSDRTTYFLSGSYTNEKGILKNDQFKRLTMRTNIESKVTNWLTVGLNSSYSYRNYSGLEASLGNARSASPLANNKIGSPKYDMYLTGEIYMPYPLNNLYVDNSDIRNSLFLVGTAKVTVPWVKGLSYELNYSNTYSNANNNTFYPVTTPEGAGNKGLAIKNPYQERNWIVNNIVTYAKTFGKHRINATFLYSRENTHTDSSKLSAQGFDNPVLGYNNMALGTVATVASTASDANGLSSMARVSYSYNDRYLLTGTVRKDGFSGFGPNKKFASFPSVSLGWVTSDEQFFKDNIKGVYLKMRASYGKNGNQGIGSYSSFSRMGTDAYVYGSQTATAIFPSTLGNADLGWETTSSFNLGLDFGFLRKRITGSIDLYNAKTTNVLVNRALPPASGYPSVWTNIGGIANKGVELNLSTLNLKGPFEWRTDFVFSLNRDKITKLYGGGNDKDLGNSWFVGQPISAIYDYQMAGGLWTENDLYSHNILNKWYPGQFKYIDQNKDGVIEPNADRTIIGYQTPNYRFSIGNTFSYKNFSLFVFVNSIQGGNGYYMANNANAINASSAITGRESAAIIRTNLTAVRPYWTPDNGVNNAAGIFYAPEVWSGVYESRSFVRLQDISLMYKFGSKALQKLGIQSAQVYLAGKNVYTWTKWSGYDPEIGVSDLPLMRNFIAGVRLTL